MIPPRPNKFVATSNWNFHFFVLYRTVDFAVFLGAREKFTHFNILEHYCRKPADIILRMFPELKPVTSRPVKNPTIFSSLPQDCREHR